MKSSPSLFNATVFKKNLTRFAPAWGLYLTAMLLLMVTIFTEDDYHLANTMGITINLLSEVSAGKMLESTEITPLPPRDSTGTIWSSLPE